MDINYTEPLSEEFIERYQELVHWDYISCYQKLSEPFIERHKERIQWYRISRYQKLSKEFRIKHIIEIDKDNWLYKPVNFKLKRLKECGLYEIQDDRYIIAYKGIRSDNYSQFNFQYQYFIGQTYTSHCNCNVDEENSFGLSAWTLEKAKAYCNQKIIKIKIPISKLGTIVHDGHKLRCFEFEVIEEVE